MQNPPCLWIRSRCPSPVCPSCLSLPLLPVWMNVSSLSPWLSDFHTVRFSVSSGCFLFLNCCCCPSFGCARRHSVSTYASILVGNSKCILKQVSKVTCTGSPGMWSTKVMVTLGYSNGDLASTSHTWCFIEFPQEPFLFR